MASRRLQNRNRFRASQQHGRAASSAAAAAARARTAARPGAPTPGVTPPRPAAPAPAAPNPNAPPPVTRIGGTMRSDALTTYNTAINQARTGVVQQALALGSPEVIQGLMQNPEYAAFVPQLQKGLGDPMSQWSTIAKTEKEDLYKTDVGNNERNAFFSGFRLQDRGKVNEGAARQRTEATNAYNQAFQDFVSSMGQAQADYQTAGREADTYDLSAAEATEPEPAAAPAAVAGKAGAGKPGKPKKPKKPSVKKKGTAKGHPKPNRRQGSGNIGR